DERGSPTSGQHGRQDRGEDHRRRTAAGAAGPTGSGRTRGRGRDPSISFARGGSPGRRLGRGGCPGRRLRRRRGRARGGRLGGGGGQWLRQVVSVVVEQRKLRSCWR